MKNTQNNQLIDLDLHHQWQRKNQTVLKLGQLVTTLLKTSSKCLRLIYLDLIITKKLAITFQLRKKNCNQSSLNDHTIRVQGKGSRFVLLTNEPYWEKFQYQINRSSFTLLNRDARKTFKDKVNLWIEKWISRKAIDKNQKRFIKPMDVKPGKIYGMIKTHKETNPERIITSAGLLKNVTSQKF